MGINALGPCKRSLMERCRSIHEKAVWICILWTLENIHNVGPSTGKSSNQDWFDSVSYARHQQSDIARNEILWESGCVYVDIDPE